jgi:putative intracellular protease/amidase
MAKDKKDASVELDEDGLVIQKYLSTVLVVVPASGYDETTLRYARSALYNVHVGTRSVSRESEENIWGRLQDEFLVDGPLEGTTMDEYSGVLFVDGDGCEEMANDPVVVQLAREAAADDKLLGAWGRSVLILAKAGVVKGKKLTGEASVKDEARRAGAKWTGVEWQRDGNFVTARDDAAGLRFGKALAQVVGIY